MPSYLSRLPLAAAAGIAALAATDCSIPVVDLGPYTTAQSGGDPDSGEAGATATAPLTDTGLATTTAAPATDAATTAGVDVTGDTSTSTTAVSATDTDSAAETDTPGNTSETSGECGDPDPLHPFPAPYVALDGETTHGSCTLLALPPPEGPGQLAIRLLCPDADDRPMIVNITILDGPLPDMTALLGQDLDVNINIEPSELGPELHWVVFSRNQNLVYAAVRGHTLLGEGVPGDAYAPFAFDTAPGSCELAPTTSDWPPDDPEGFACELAAPIFLGVRVNQDPKLLLKSGFTLEAPVVGGKYRLEVRAVTQGHNCIPGFTPDTQVDTYAFAVALQPD